MNNSQQPLDIQTIITNAVSTARTARMNTSTQLTLGELTLKMEAIKNKDLPVVFDDLKHFPVTLSSWRGAYDELAFEYSCDDTEKTVHTILSMLKEAMGKTYTGYKGGDFIMGKLTPVWVANWGESCGFRSNEDYDSLAIVDVVEDDTVVIIKTELMSY
jgi:hypothetical protein